MTPELAKEILTVIGTVLALIAGKTGAVRGWGWMKTNVTADLDKRITALENFAAAKKEYADMDKKVRG